MDVTRNGGKILVGHNDTDLYVTIVGVDINGHAGTKAQNILNGEDPDGTSSIHILLLRME